MKNPLLAKCLALIVVALVIVIPLSMIKMKISERAEARDSARMSVAASWTGEQQIMGPIIAIPYERSVQLAVTKDQGVEFKQKKQFTYRYVVPALLAVDAKIDAEERYKGIYKIPVYTTALDFSGQFLAKDIRDAINALKQRADVLRVDKPRLFWGISDPRGINHVSDLVLRKQKFTLSAGALSGWQDLGVHTDLDETVWQGSQPLTFEFSMTVRGMHQVNFLPVARQNDFSLTANWPHPEFIGSFLPTSRRIDNNGFEAHWQINSFASNIEERLKSCELSVCSHWDLATMGVRLVDPIDVYLQSERAVKYGFLFVALIFVAFFMFEILKTLRIHPVQYGLVGVSIAIFFLLLIALAEHMSFASAYLLATFASILVMAGYLRSFLGEWQPALGFSTILAVLHGLLYMIIQSEDYALLMGALLCFSVLAAVMYFTRNIDWYNLTIGK